MGRHAVRGMLRVSVLVVGLVLVLSGCASDPAPAPTVTVTAFATVTATPQPPAAPATPVALGTVVDQARFSITAHAVDQDSVPPPAPQPERDTDKWVSADVEFCSKDIEGTLSSHPWRLVGQDNRRFESSSTGYSQFPEPPYAWGDVPIHPGECIRGWITFVVAKDAALRTLRYENSEGTIVEWAAG